ncbi:MAG TPA: hypothetical protein VM051_00080 [Usitatibacter sp.]|nr:hypothetical protein [Usitatibacter sp.]
MKRDAAFAFVPITLVDEAGIRGRISAIDLPCANVAAATQGFFTVADEFAAAKVRLRAVLIETSLEWMEEEKRCAAFVHGCCDDLARIGFRIAQSGIATWGIEEPRVLRLIARTLQFMGDTVKWEMAVTPGASQDLAKTHRLMRQALEAAQHRHPMAMQCDGLTWQATIEGLYFRALLLGWYASGALNCKQIEIIDSWIWTMMPSLSGVVVPPPGAAFRADLDSHDGLRRGPRQSAGPSLYLPQAPLIADHQKILAEFQAGRIVPHAGTASRLRIEEHVHVLAMVRRNLRESMREPVPRAQRTRCDRSCEMLVGLAEVRAWRGIAARAPLVASLMAAGDSRGSRATLPSVMDQVYERNPRIVAITDESANGFGLEADEESCNSLAQGDLVALIAVDGATGSLARVVRRVPARTAGRVTLGLSRLAPLATNLHLVREVAGRGPEPVLMPFVPGADASGRHDGFLVDEDMFRQLGVVTATLGDRHYQLRLNRVRERGRGWVLAGFEVISAQSRG